MDETTQQPEISHHEGRLSRFTRKHPGLTIAGLAVAGLAGGVELAAGMVLGAGVAALIRRPREGAAPSEPSAQPETRMHELRQRFEERARAVISAARGEIGVPAH
jgi:hypothetical protein